MDQKLLLTRQQAAEMLACSTMTVVRMEKRGVLTPIKLNNKETARAYYARQQIEALVAGLLEQTREAGQ